MMDCQNTLIGGLPYGTVKDTGLARENLNSGVAFSCVGSLGRDRRIVMMKIDEPSPL